MMMMRLGGALVYISFLPRLVFAQTSLCVVLAPKYLVLVFPNYYFITIILRLISYLYKIHVSDRPLCCACTKIYTKYQYYQDTTFFLLILHRISLMSCVGTGVRSDATLYSQNIMLILYKLWNKKKWIFILQRNDHMTQKWDSERNVDKSCQGWSCWGRGLWNFLSPLKSSAHPERLFSVHMLFFVVLKSVCLLYFILLFCVLFTFFLMQK